MIIKIKDSGIPDAVALRCVLSVVEGGRVSNEGRSYCWLMTFATSVGIIAVHTMYPRKDDVFWVYKWNESIKPNNNVQEY